MSFGGTDDDGQQRFALGFLFALIALVVSTVVGVAVYQRGIAAAKPKAAATQAVVVEEAASVRVENGVVLFFFASGKADLAAGANEALTDIVQGANVGKKAVISGFHDATGNAEQNAELAKNRALAVREALKALGVAEDIIELRKPEMTQGTGSNAEARRVEVVLAGS